jgi:hypothetical protein
MSEQIQLLFMKLMHESFTLDLRILASSNILTINHDGNA